MKKLLHIAAIVTLVSACESSSLRDSVDYASPESLLDVSTEAVTIGLDSTRSLSELRNFVSSDAPSRADLECELSNIRCAQAKEILDNSNIPSTVVGGGDHVVLVYERVVARDCDSTYRDNRDPLIHYPSNSFGCANRANMIQAVTDRKQFVNPSLLDHMDGEKAVQTYGAYLSPSEPSGDSSLESLLGDLGGGGGSQ